MSKEAVETQAAPTFPSSLLSKLAKVQKDVTSVPKNGYNPHFNYHYPTEADVVEAIKASFIKNGLVYSVSVEDVQIVMNGQKPLTQVRCLFTIIDTETGQSSFSRFFGHGEDKGDKGIYKAVTGAQKYYFMKTFLVATNDDPEQAVTTASAAEEKAAPAAEAAPAAAATEAAPAPKKKPSSFRVPKPQGQPAANGSADEPAWA